MIGTSGSLSTYSDTISGMILFICLGLILLLLMPPGLAVEVHKDSGLYSVEFWQEVRAELQKEVQRPDERLAAHC